MLGFTGSSDVKRYVKRYLSRLDLRGKRIIDVPAGAGVTSALLRDGGAEVVAYDLFPEFFKADGLRCTQADLTQGLTDADHSADMVICQEGMEHLPNQLATLREFNRVLKPAGKLLVTVPNISHLRAKVSFLLNESDLYNRMPPNELDALWHATDGKQYFGHIFLINIQRLRVLAAAAGFRLRTLHPVKASWGALMFAPLYPLVALANFYAYAASMRRKDGISKGAKRQVYGEILRLNLHPTVLFGKHLFLEFDKVAEAESAGLEVNRGG